MAISIETLKANEQLIDTRTSEPVQYDYSSCNGKMMATFYPADMSMDVITIEDALKYFVEPGPVVDTLFGGGTTWTSK